MAETTFQDLDRVLRQEILAIDGATILRHDGTIVAVGAILNIESGSDAGARKAAALALANHGLGVKVSADGSISVLRKAPSDKKAREMFYFGPPRASS